MFLFQPGIVPGYTAVTWSVRPLRRECEEWYLGGGERANDGLPESHREGRPVPAFVRGVATTSSRPAYEEAPCRYVERGSGSHRGSSSPFSGTTPISSRKR